MVGEKLAEITAGTDTAATVVEAIVTALDQPPDDPYDAHKAARTLLAVAADRPALAAAHLAFVLREPRSQPFGYIPRGVGQLAARLAGGDALAAALTDALTDASTPTRQLAAAQALLAVVPGTRTATTALWRVVDDPNTSPEQRHTAIRVLLDQDQPDRQRATALLNDVVTRDPPTGRVPVLNRIDAARLLLHNVMSSDCAGSLLISMLTDSTSSAWRREQVRAALTWPPVGPSGRHAVIDWLRAEVADPQLPTRHRCAAANSLAELTRHHHDEILHSLRPLLHRDHQAACCHHDSCRHVAKAIIGIAPDDHAALATLRHLLTDPNGHPRTRQNAALALATGDPAHRQQAADDLRKLLAGTLSPHDQVWAATTLANTGHHGRIEATTVLQRLATDTGIGPHTRTLAATSLCEIGGPGTRTGQILLLALLTDRRLPAHHRITAGATLTAKPGPHRADAEHHLLQLTGAVTDQVAAAVATIHGTPAGRRAAISHIHTLINDPNLPAHTLVTAAGKLIGHDGQTALVHRLDTLTGQPDIHPYLRITALRVQAQLEPSQAQRCTTQLWTILADPDAPVDHRRWAGEATADLLGEQREAIREILQTIPTRPLDERAGRRLARSIAQVEGL